MKKLNLLVLTSLFTFLGLGLIAQIKHVSPNVQHVGKDGTNSSKANSLKIDIDNDGTDDFYVSHLIYLSFNIWNLNFNQFDDQSPKIEFLYDKSLTISPVGGEYLKKVSAGDEVSGKATNWTAKYPVLADVYNSNFLSAGEQYIGFRLLKAGGKYKYGWMKVDVSGSADYTISIKEYAYQSIENQSIKVGETTSVGIHDISNSLNNDLRMSLFPNPSYGKVSVELNKIDSELSIQVLSLDGRVQFATVAVQTNTQIDLSGFPSGMYYVVVSGNDERIVAPLIVK